MDDEGAQQARRRRFQTGLFMILVLLLMDPKTMKQVPPFVSVGVWYARQDALSWVLFK